MAAIGIFLILVFIGFIIYLVFKSIQFTIQAVNLYKEMIARQDVMVKLLKDIRDRVGSEGNPGMRSTSSDRLRISGAETEEEIEAKTPTPWKIGSSNRKNIEDDIRSGDLSREGLMVKHEINQGLLNLICRSMLMRGLITDEQGARLVREVDEFAV